MHQKQTRRCCEKLRQTLQKTFVQNIFTTWTQDSVSRKERVPCTRGYVVNLKTLGLTKLLLYMVPALVGTYTKAAKSKRAAPLVSQAHGRPACGESKTFHVGLYDPCISRCFFFGIMFILIFNFEQRIGLQSAGSFSPAPMSLGCWLACLLFTKQLDLKKFKQRWVLASSFLNCCSHIME